MKKPWQERMEIVWDITLSVVKDAAENNNVN